MGGYSFISKRHFDWLALKPIILNFRKPRLNVCVCVCVCVSVKKFKRGRTKRRIRRPSGVGDGG